MRTPYYREQALEGIACEVITAYDPNLYYGVPRMIPIEDIIEAQGITLEYQCLRKTGCVLGETIFDDGGAIIYDYDILSETLRIPKGCHLFFFQIPHSEKKIFSRYFGNWGDSNSPFCDFKGRIQRNALFAGAE